MKHHGIRAKGNKMFTVTTDSEHALPIATDFATKLPNREFTVAQPNTVWTSKLFCFNTNIHTCERWLYLVAVIDLFSRKVVGWSMLRLRGTQMYAGVVTNVLRMAWFGRRPPLALVLHLDRGSQYCSREIQGALRACGKRHAVIDEPQGRLLGQRARRKVVGPLEGDAHKRPEVRHAARGSIKTRRVNGQLRGTWMRGKNSLVASVPKVAPIAQRRLGTS